MQILLFLELYIYFFRFLKDDKFLGAPIIIFIIFEDFLKIQKK
jgi:hypothetical protein